MIALLMRVGSEVVRLRLTLLRYKKVSKNKKSKIIMGPLRNYIFTILNKLLNSQLRFQKRSFRSIFQKAAALTSKSVTFFKSVISLGFLFTNLGFVALNGHFLLSKFSNICINHGPILLEFDFTGSDLFFKLCL